MTDSTARGLADFIHGLQLQDVPAPVRQRALHLALDATGCALAARHEAFAPGERLYGFWPMATHAVLTPERVSAQGFTEAAAHRRALPAAYNRYLFTHADPFHRPETEAVQALLRPLHGTSWLIDDFLSDSEIGRAHV